MNIKPPYTLCNDQFKDTKLNGIQPIFDFKNSLIEDKDILFENEKLFKTSNETQGKQTYRFPVEAFPLSIQQIITATNESLGYPIDYIGTSLIYVLSVAIGNIHRIEIKKRCLESVAIYLILVGPQRSNKNASPSFALQPRTDHDEKSHEVFVEQNKNAKG